jgi:signal transduction histidine kinase
MRLQDCDCLIGWWNASLNPTIEHRFIRQDGELVWVKATFAGVKDHSGEHFSFFVVMVEDITERKNTELELAEMKARFLTSVEVERLSLAQELHDGAMQDLHSVIFQAEDCGRRRSGRW